jgi:hypothetical protein
MSRHCHQSAGRARHRAYGVEDAAQAFTALRTLDTVFYL